MDAMKAIEERWSVRSFTKAPVSEDKLDAVVRAGASAAATPMGGRVHLNVVTNKAVLDAINASSREQWLNSKDPAVRRFASNEEYDSLYGAPVVVIVSVEDMGNETKNSMGVQNAACAAQNMLVAATAVGLGSCYSMRPAAACMEGPARETAKIPEGNIIVCSVLLGEAAAEATPAPKFRATVSHVK